MKEKIILALAILSLLMRSQTGFAEEIKAEKKESKSFWSSLFGGKKSAKAEKEAQVAESEDDLFLSGDDIFQEMELMRQKMDEMFLAHQKQMKKILDEMHKNGRETSQVSTSLSSKENDEEYYYELKFSGFKKEDIIVKVEDKILTLSAKRDQKNKEKSQSFQLASDFYYQLSLPEYNAKKDPEIIREDDTIIVKLAKK